MWYYDRTSLTNQEGEQNASCTKPMALHFIIYQQLCRKSLNLSCVVNQEVSSQLHLLK
jgi:hypothetical protein